MKKFTAFTDQNAVQSAVMCSDYVDAHVLAANVAETFTKPVGARFCRLTGTALFFYSTTGTAAVPAADIATGLAPVIVNTTAQPILCVDDIASISVVASTVATVTAEWWA